MNGYNRPWMSFDQQLQQLKDRGLEVTDVTAALDYLDRLGYYRLSAYMYPFRKIDLAQEEGGDIQIKRLDEFVEAASFQEAVDYYVFDKRLRLLALDALERIEVAIRVDIAYLLGERDTYAYANPAELDSSFVSKVISHSGSTKFQEWTERYEAILQRSRETFVSHYLSKYGPPLPFWVAIEIWDFGLLSKFYSGIKNSDQRLIASKYGLGHGKIFGTWLRSLNYLRNLCAHHSRVWNRNIIDQPRLPPPGQISDFDNFIGKADLISRSFLLFCVIQFLMKQICPASTWGDRFKALMADFPASRTGKAPVSDMGCISGWEKWELWEGANRR